MNCVVRSLGAIAQCTGRICKPDGGRLGQALSVTLDDGTTLFLTCYHVVTQVADRHDIPLDLFSATDEHVRTLRVRHCPERSDPSLDVAVLLANEPTAFPTIQLYELPSSYRAGDEVEVVNRPTAGMSQRFNARLGSPTPLTIAEHRISVPRAWRLREPQDTRPGISGSPVILDDGVIGLTHFSRAETDDAAREAYVVPIETWFNKNPELKTRSLPFAQTPQPPLFQETFDQDSAGIHRFLYRSRTVKFCGRVTETKALEEFLADPQLFSWLLMTGQGGSGKSRLALELCLRVAPQWHAGFFLRDEQFDFRAWIPNRATLIVCDYVAARSKDVGTIVRTLAKRSKTLPLPVRILLLERSSEGAWVNDFLGIGSDSQVTHRSMHESRYFRRQQAPTDGQRDEREQLDQSQKLDSLDLETLGDDALWSMVSAIIDGSGSQRDAAGEARKAHLLAQLNRLDRSGRPLFAMLFADAVAANRDARRWDEKALIRDVLAREDLRYWQPAGVTAVERDLLALATLSRGIDPRAGDLPEPLRAMLAQCSPQRYEVMAGVRCDEAIAPLEPDMVGEIFVLNHYERKKFIDERASQARQIAWKVRPAGMEQFLRLAAQDFPKDEALWELAQFPEHESPSIRMHWFVAMCAALPACSKAGVSEKRVGQWVTDLWVCYHNLSAPMPAEESMQFANRLGGVFFEIGKLDDTLTLLIGVIEKFTASKEPAARKHVARALVNKGLTLSRLRRFTEAIAVYDTMVVRYSGDAEPDTREQVARALVNRGYTLEQLERLPDALTAYDDVVARFSAAGEPGVREYVARALLNKGNALLRLGRFPEAMSVYNDLVADFSAAAGPGIRAQVARALVNRGYLLEQLERWDEAISYYDEMVARFSAAAEPSVREDVARALVNKASVLRKLLRWPEAIAVCVEVLERFSDATDSLLREQVAKAMVGRGYALGQLGRPLEAIAVYDDLLARFAAAGDSGIREHVTRALVNKGFEFEQLSRFTDAIALYDQVVARSADATEAAERELIGKALLNKAHVLRLLERPLEALSVWDDVVARFSDAPEPAAREQAARALNSKGYTLGNLKRELEEIAAYDELIARYSSAPEGGLREQVARALANKAYALDRLGRLPGAISVWDEVVGRLATATELGVREQVARALASKAYALDRLGRLPEAISVCDDIVARFSSAQEDTLREEVSRAFVSKGYLLERTDRRAEALIVYDDVVDRFSPAVQPALREQVARALVNKGYALEGLKRPGDAVDAYDDVVARYSPATEPRIRAQVGQALVNRGYALRRLERWEDTLTNCDDVVSHFEITGGPRAREAIANALVSKESTLRALERWREAIAICDDVAARFSASEDSALGEQVAAAMLDRGYSLDRLGRPSEAIAAYDEMLARFLDAPEPRTRELVVRVLMNKGYVLEANQQYAEALAVYDHLLARFSAVDEPAVQEQCSISIAEANRQRVLDARQRAVEQNGELLTLSNASPLPRSDGP